MSSRSGLPDLDLAALQRPLMRAAARRKYLPFVRYLFPGFQVAPHHQKIADALEGVANGTVKRLVISLAPRHGKSTLCSVYFAPWLMGLNPDTRIISCSYSAELSHSFSRQARNVLLSPEYSEIFGNPAISDQSVELAADSRSIAMWDLAPPHRGGFVSAGVGGSITGKGANCLIIDDPLRDQEEARSPLIKENLWSWYRETAFTRLQGNGSVVVIGTRWADDDLIGRILAQAEEQGRLDQWTVLTLPALAEGDDPLGRQPGDALWPEAFPVETLQDIRLTLGERSFAALYQSRPAPEEGLYIKKAWIRYFDPRMTLPRFRRVLQSWDCAYKEGKENDYSVCVTYGMAERPRPSAEGNVVSLRGSKAHDLYLLDVYRAKLSFPGLVQAIQDQYAKWCAVPGCRPNEILIEDKASGTSAYQSLRHATDMPVRSVKVDRDKISRMNAVSTWYEQGRIYHPKGAEWLDVYEHELMTFPGTKHDDQVDATTMAIERLLGPAGAAAFLSYMRDQSSGVNRPDRKKTEIALPAGIQIAHGL